MREKIITAAARAFFASAWADQQEENGRSLHGEIIGMLPAGTDPAAIHAAETLAMDWERKHDESIEDTYRMVRTCANYPTQPLTPEEFGHLAAMQAMGHGVGFADRDIDLEVPYVEFGAYSLENDYE